MEIEKWDLKWGELNESNMKKKLENDGLRKRKREYPAMRTGLRKRKRESSREIVLAPSMVRMCPSAVRVCPGVVSVRPVRKDHFPFYHRLAIILKGNCLP